MAIKRVILANDSRLLREIFQRVIDKTDHLEVVYEIRNHAELPSAIQRFDPQWVILTMSNNVQGWIDACMAEYTSVRFIFLSPDNRSVKMRQISYEEDLTNLSLKDLIHILEKDLQHI